MPTWADGRRRSRRKNCVAASSGPVRIVFASAMLICWMLSPKTAAAMGDKYWTAEMILPYAIFGLNGRGTTTWRANCHRIFRDNAVDKCSWMFPGIKSNPWHDTTQFGKLEFMN